MSAEWPATTTLTQAERRRMGDLYRARFAALHPREVGESAMSFAARALAWLASPEGRGALADAVTEARRT